MAHPSPKWQVSHMVSRRPRRRGHGRATTRTVSRSLPCFLLRISNNQLRSGLLNLSGTLAVVIAVGGADYRAQGCRPPGREPRPARRSRSPRRRQQRRSLSRCQCPRAGRCAAAAAAGGATVTAHASADPRGMRPPHLVEDCESRPQSPRADYRGRCRRQEVATAAGCGGVAAAAPPPPQPPSVAPPSPAVPRVATARQLLVAPPPLLIARPHRD